MKCDCDEWEPNIEKVQAPFLLQWARSGVKIHYEGVIFRFCPWCGSALKCEHEDEME